MKVSKIVVPLPFCFVLASVKIARAAGADDNYYLQNESFNGRNLTAAATVSIKRSFSIHSPMGTIQLCACNEEDCAYGSNCADSNSINFVTRSDMVSGDLLILDSSSSDNANIHEDTNSFDIFQDLITDGLDGYVVTTDFQGYTFSGGGSQDIASETSYFKGQPGTLNNIDLQGIVLDSLSLTVDEMEIKTVGYPGQYEERWTIDATIVYWARACDQATDPNNCVPVTNSDAPSVAPSTIPIPSPFKLNDTGLEAAVVIHLGQSSGGVDNEFTECILRVCAAKTRNECAISENAIEFLITPDMVAGTTETVNAEVDSSYNAFSEHITDGLDDWIVTSHFPGLVNNGGGGSESYRESQYFSEQTGPKNLIDLQGCDIVAISIMMNEDVHFFSRGSINNDKWMTYRFDITLIFWTHEDSECFDPYAAPKSDAPSTIPKLEPITSFPSIAPDTKMAPNPQNSSVTNQDSTSNLYIYIIASMAFVFVLLEIWCCVRLKPIAMIRQYRKNGTLSPARSQSTECEGDGDNSGDGDGDGSSEGGERQKEGATLQLILCDDHSSVSVD